VGLWERLFSSDYRVAVAAEAAGDLELAAERYALAGHPDEAARIHLARAERARSRHDEIAALRDAVHWAEGDIRRRAERALGLGLMAQARAEAVATDRDRKRVREAAVLLEAAGDHRAAAEAFELAGDSEAAAAALRAGGHVHLLEDALDREAERGAREREVREAWADFEVAERGGERDAAITALRRCVAAADDRAEARRRLDDLEARLLAGWRVELALRGGGRIIASGAPRLVMGRDALIDLPLRSAGVSRSHAEIRRGEDGAYLLADLGSRNGTRVGGLPIAAPLRLGESGRFALGDGCELDYRAADGGLLALSIERGLDGRTTVYLAPPDARIELQPHGLAAALGFRRGRPILIPAAEVVLNGERLVRVEVQLVRGDQIAIDGVELEVR
jgi:tetratricopeptide (TPR) repeat protein